MLKLNTFADTGANQPNGIVFQYAYFFSFPDISSTSLVFDKADSHDGIFRPNIFFSKNTFE
jgi:hypothetical protein